ncbi:hypothetical protein H7F51_05605 [Novosphingobium flavum]|uniref:TonB C-terminal domain-containing protein n=1 Tax=Novosphingobium flavum TaxID=1778672 RepID=A0A7X1FQC9_9SPHN|nr:hypothetical protein [Novosphingobium flavum]MBC2664983.1 hypothetical protein [Novosphingobium flavum]
MKLLSRLIPIAALLLAAPLAAEDLPPVPRELLGRSAVACVKLGEGGEVASAYLAVSSGTPESDGEMLAWVRALRWQAAFTTPAPAGWFAMPLAFGEGEPPLTPTRCGPASATFT